MATIENKWERIHKYLSGEMNEAEVREFKKSIQEDHDLAEGLAMEASLRQSRLQSWQYTRQAIKRSHRRRIIIRWLIGIVTLIVITSVSIWLWQHYALINSNEGKQQLDNTIASQIDQEYLAVAGGTKWKSLLLKGEENRVYYRQAATILKAELDGLGCEKGDLQYYYGLLLLYEYRNYKNAAIHLSCALSRDYQEARPQLPFHLSLALIGVGDLGQARQLIEEYQLPLDEFSDKARRKLRSSSK